MRQVDKTFPLTAKKGCDGFGKPDFDVKATEHVIVSVSVG